MTIYDCGHTVSAGGDLIVGTPCPACVASSQAELVGSPKQVAWAERIRRTALVGVADFVDRGLRRAPADDPNRDAFAAIPATLRAISAASWWIDHRDASAQTLVKIAFAWATEASRV